MNTKLLMGALAAGSMLALLGSGAMAAPPSPNFQFGLTLGGPQTPPSDDDCLTTKEIIGDLSGSGYSKFRNFDDSDDEDYFIIDARRGSRVYRLTVDNCDGEILSRKRLFQNY